MQGKKNYQEKLFTNFQLSDHVPKDNFYYRLKAQLDLDYLNRLTQGYYGACGQKSIDPVVFFKLCLVGYLENIISDRKLVTHCSMRLDILFFLDYDIDESSVFLRNSVIVIFSVLNYYTYPPQQKIECAISPILLIHSEL